MAKNIVAIAAELGAKVVGEIPDTGGGAFGAARLAKIIEQVRSRLIPSKGRRTGRPTDARWVRHPKVPMSEATKRTLDQLAEQASSEGRRVSPMQIAAQILETAVSGLSKR